MLDERKVKLMTQLALYDQTQGKGILKSVNTIEKIMPECTFYIRFCG